MIVNNLPLEFDWDIWNFSKNLEKHSVTIFEIEEIFFNEPLIIYPDINHSQQEERFYCLGRTNTNIKLFTSFTIKDNKIRVISSRPMSRKERKIYEKA